MKNRNLLTLIAITGFIAVSSFSFTGCDLYEATGYPVVENTIPDLVLIRAEGWRRDLESPPFIFAHTGEARLYYDAFSSDPVVASAYVRDDFLYVDAGVPGSTVIRVEAEDSDGEYAFVTFTVTVLVSAASQ